MLIFGAVLLVLMDLPSPGTVARTPYLIHTQENIYRPGCDKVILEVKDLTLRFGGLPTQ